jgi:sigma-B regulation protein RsbU (phosphoserine phosphatase)
LQLCERLRSRVTDRFLPVLLIAAGRNPSVRSAGLECGADACLVRPFEPEEFVAQVRALLRLKRGYDRLAAKAAECVAVHQQLQQAYQQMDRELDLSRRIQQRLLPRRLPETPHARFAVHYRPCGRAGGDLYDVAALGENLVGFYLADVVGHGVPASLLSVYVTEAVRSKQISDGKDCLVPPHELLESLNRDLIELAVADSPFLTMVYAVFDGRDGTLALARAGQPQPLNVPRGGEPRWCSSQGTLLGLFDTQFTTQTLQLRPGDKLLLCSDGLEALTSADPRPATERFLAGAIRSRTLSVQELVDRLAQDLLEQSNPPEDFTLLGFEVHA